MPLKVRVDSLLDLMKASFDGSAERFVGCVGRWFAREFAEASADDRLDVLNQVRPTLRHVGFDVCDSELGEPVGCEYCMNPGPYGACADIPCDDSKVRANMALPLGYTDACSVRPELNVMVRLDDQYGFGIGIPINYCPMCGRWLGGDE